MKKLLTAIVVASSFVVTATATADTATSLKHAEKSAETRKAVYGLLGSNMGPLGAMAKGKIPFDAKAVEKYALRINQLSLMIEDYMRTDTSGFDVPGDALKDIWEKPEAFEKRTNALVTASADLLAAAKLGEESAIKKAIGGVGKSCGGCHNEFRED
ncbi:cytochrome c [Pseudocolwellia sp. AS88]|jgi:cytochrome c556|uniref:c-type cytochrome n=1 Tax=Pseudocolwellia TaxID=2848177 RepID=UPI0026F1AA71|nr:cytochrome c [Pseudocolwellia sp. AS88]MDO7085211.1 cytochrome c [Pseudocolwellia sp. AS88]